MPGPEVCNLIEDPDEQERCLTYKGEYAKQEVNEGMNPIDYASDMEFDDETILNPTRRVPGTTY